MIGWKGLADPQMRIILDQRIAIIQKLKHLEKSEFTNLLDLLATHYVRILRSYLPKQSKLYNRYFSTDFKLKFKKLFEKSVKIFDDSQ